MTEPTGDAQRRLYDDLNDARAPAWLLEKVAADYYHDYESPSPAPKHLLVEDLKFAGLHEQFAPAVKTGEYDDDESTDSSEWGAIFDG